MGVIVPITWLRALRFYLVARPGALPGVVEALRLTLVSAAANIFMPASSGDLVKSYFIARSGGGSVLLARLLRGRLSKLLALAEGWPGMMAMLRGRRVQVVALSLLLWFIHLLQIYMFTIALAMRIPLAVSASLSAIALMAGQLPFAFGGLGARDVAIVLLLKNYARPESAAALGLLMATRNFLPPLAALPIVRPYAAAVAREMWLGPRTEED